MARLILPELTISEKDSWPIALSFLYAFIEGVSSALQIERNDINGILEMNLNTESYDILLYDDLSGGAGHVKRLCDKNLIKKSLSSAYKKCLGNVVMRISLAIIALETIIINYFTAT